METVGGGTGLPGQSACLELLGIRGAHPTTPATNSKTLAKIVCATVMVSFFLWLIHTLAYTEYVLCIHTIS